MKHLFLFSLILISSFKTNAQDITGIWNGELKIPTGQLKVVIHIKQSGTGLSATMDSPNQNAFGIPVTNITFENLKLHFDISGAIVYEGELQADTIKGIFKQNGYSFPLNLSKGAGEQKEILRPQEPKKPFPYLSEDITFENKKDNLILSGTLTLPEKGENFPAVVLIAGSGPQNRDEEVFGHKPFLVLSDYLTKNGIAVLRFDKRGIGKSTGDYKRATTLDFASDVESAVKYLDTRKEINKKKIGLIGHSEGGAIAPIVALNAKSNISFIVLMAAPGIQGDKLLLLQAEKIEKSNRVSDTDLQKLEIFNKATYDIVKNSKDSEFLKNNLSEYVKNNFNNLPEFVTSGGMNAEEQIINQLTSPWVKYFIKYNPAPVLQKVKCPVLAINGEKDLQVPAKVDLAAIKNALEKGGNKNVTIKELPNLNHLFQECKTCTIAEYATIEQTISPTALLIIKDWIIKQTNKEKF